MFRYPKTLWSCFLLCTQRPVTPPENHQAIKKFSCRLDGVVPGTTMAFRHQTHSYRCDTILLQHFVWFPARRLKETRRASISHVPSKERIIKFKRRELWIGRYQSKRKGSNRPVELKRWMVFGEISLLIYLTFDGSVKQDRPEVNFEISHASRVTSWSCFSLSTCCMSMLLLRL